MSKERTRNLDIVEEEVKTRHTTHWDLDYLPMAEIEKMYRRGKNAPNAGGGPSGQAARYLVPMAVAAAIAMAVAGFFIFLYPG
jgi:hypothetical protein